MPKQPAIVVIDEAQGVSEALERIRRSGVRADSAYVATTQIRLARARHPPPSGEPNPCGEIVLHHPKDPPYGREMELQYRVIKNRDPVKKREEGTIKIPLDVLKELVDRVGTTTSTDFSGNTAVYDFKGNYKRFAEVGSALIKRVQEIPGFVRASFTYAGAMGVSFIFSRHLAKAELDWLNEQMEELGRPYSRFEAILCMED